MKIHRIRLGFATSSSSSHSLLIGCKQGSILEECDSEFGWDWFHLTKPEDKRRYIATQFKFMLPKLFYGGAGDSIVEEIFDVKLTENALIGNQSHWYSPRRFDRTTPHEEFLETFFTYVINSDNISICGGNDNGDAPNWVTGRSGMDRFLDSGYICRKDGENYVLFDTQYGTKMRVSFSGMENYTCSTKPELVDLKITDKCHHGCAFCYQDSKPNGKHADYDAVVAVLRKLAEAEVFEVVIGGGDPVLHPRFPAILREAKKLNLTVSFTTKDMSFAGHGNIAEAVRKYAKSFAISTITPDEIEKLKAFNNKEDGEDTQTAGSLHIPLGCYSEDEIVPLLAKSKHDLVRWGLNGGQTVFLGFKDVGRGASFKPHDDSWVLKYLKRKQYFVCGGDTAFISKFHDQLVDLGVSTKLMVDNEGHFSCYMDAVSMKMGASSYSEDLHPINMDDPWEKFPYVEGEE